MPGEQRFDYEAFVRELRRLAEAPTFGSMGPKYTEDLVFRAWKHNLVDLIQRIEAQGYEVHCNVRSRFFSPRVRSGGGGEAARRQAYAEAFFAAVNQTLIEIRTIISRFEDYGVPPMKIATPANSGNQQREQGSAISAGTTYNITNASGQIQIGSHGSTQAQANSNGVDLGALNGLIAALGEVLDRTESEAVAELRADLATMKAQAASPKPKWEIIKAMARSFKTVAEGATGSILGELAKPHIATLIALAT